MASRARPPETFAPLAIVAGGGSAPAHVAAAAAASGRDVMVVGIRGEADESIAAFKHEWIRWGELGRLERLLTAHGTRDIVLVGGVSARPDMKSLRPDLGTLKRLPQILASLANGDDGLLSAVVRMLERDGYRVVGAHEIATDLVAGEGLLGAARPGKEARADIVLATRAARTIGALDAGQAAVAVEGRVVALEAAEGTDAMLARVADLRARGRLKWQGRVGVLAKCAKPQQDLRVDMPAIGPATVEAVAAAGLAGIAIETGRVMIIDRAETLARADRTGTFISGEPAEARP